MQCAKCKAAALKSNELPCSARSAKVQKRSREWKREIMRDSEDNPSSKPMWDSHGSHIL